MSTAAIKGAFRASPPAISGLHKPQNVATGAAAVSTPIFSGLSASAPTGPCFVTFKAITQDVYLRIGASAAAATTSTNGYPLAAGSEVTYWLNPNTDTNIDHIAPGGVGALRWYVSSEAFGGK